MAPKKGLKEGARRRARPALKKEKREGKAFSSWQHNLLLVTSIENGIEEREVTELDFRVFGKARPRLNALGLRFLPPPPPTIPSIAATQESEGKPSEREGDTRGFLLDSVFSVLLSIYTGWLAGFEPPILASFLPRCVCMCVWGAAEREGRKAASS